MCNSFYKGVNEMKATKVIGKVFQILAAVLYAASFVIACVLSNDNQNDAAYVVLITACAWIVAAATVGIFLISAKNDTAKKIGHGLTLSAYAVGLAYALLTLTAQGDASLGALLMIAAAALLAAFYICKLLGVIMNKGLSSELNPNDDIRIIRIKEWKHIMEEGIISEEEFEEKRIAILGIKANKNETKVK